MSDPAYLAYLASGGELLRAARIEEACAELERARALEPDDVRAQGLLAVAYFRSGRLEEAHELYVALCRRDPTDASLHLNLGLILLKTGRHDDAIDELGRAQDLGAPPARVAGYLGLAYARQHRYAEARDAFRAAGQDDLAVEMEVQLEDHGEPEPEPQPQPERQPEPEPEPEREEEDTLVPAAAAPPIILPDPVGAARDAGPVVGAAAGDAAAPAPPLPPRQEVVAPEPGDTFARERGVRTIGAFGTERLIRPDQGDLPIEIVAGGALVIRVRGRVLSRTEGVVVSGGELAYEPATRRAEGRAMTAPFGSPNRPLFIVSGGGYLIAAPRGGVFSALRLRDDVVYIREELVYAFEERLEWENGEIAGSAGGPGEAPGMAIVRLRGYGFLAMRTEREPLTVKLGAGKISYVDASVLAGWIGEVSTRLVAPAAGGAASTPFVECSGEGVILVETPGAA